MGRRQGRTKPYLLRHAKCKHHKDREVGSNQQVHSEETDATEEDKSLDHTKEPPDTVLEQEAKHGSASKDTSGEIDSDSICSTLPSIPYSRRDGDKQEKLKINIAAKGSEAECSIISEETGETIMLKGGTCRIEKEGKEDKKVTVFQLSKREAETMGLTKVIPRSGTKKVGNVNLEVRNVSGNKRYISETSSSVSGVEKHPFEQNDATIRATMKVPGETCRRSSSLAISSDKELTSPPNDPTVDAGINVAIERSPRKQTLTCREASNETASAAFQEVFIDMTASSEEDSPTMVKDQDGESANRKPTKKQILQYRQKGHVYPEILSPTCIEEGNLAKPDIPPANEVSSNSKSNFGPPLAVITMKPVPGREGVAHMVTVPLSGNLKLPLTLNPGALGKIPLDTPMAVVKFNQTYVLVPIEKFEIPEHGKHVISMTKEIENKKSSFPAITVGKSSTSQENTRSASRVLERTKPDKPTAEIIKESSSETNASVSGVFHCQGTSSNSVPGTVSKAAPPKVATTATVSMTPRSATSSVPSSHMMTLYNPLEEKYKYLPYSGGSAKHLLATPVKPQGKTVPKTYPYNCPFSRSSNVYYVMHEAPDNHNFAVISKEEVALQSGEDVGNELSPWHYGCPICILDCDENYRSLESLYYHMWGQPGIMMVRPACPICLKFSGEHGYCIKTPSFYIEQHWKHMSEDHPVHRAPNIAFEVVFDPATVAKRSASRRFIFKDVSEFFTHLNRHFDIVKVQPMCSLCQATSDPGHMDFLKPSIYKNHHIIHHRQCPTRGVLFQILVRSGVWKETEPRMMEFNKQAPLHSRICCGELSDPVTKAKHTLQMLLPKIKCPAHRDGCQFSAWNLKLLQAHAQEHAKEAYVQYHPVCLNCLTKFDSFLEVAVHLFEKHSGRGQEVMYPKVWALPPDPLKQSIWSKTILRDLLDKDFSVVPNMSRKECHTEKLCNVLTGLLKYSGHEVDVDNQTGKQSSAPKTRTSYEIRQVVQSKQALSDLNKLFPNDKENHVKTTGVECSTAEIASSAEEMVETIEFIPPYSKETVSKWQEEEDRLTIACGGKFTAIDCVELGMILVLKPIDSCFNPDNESTEFVYKGHGSSLQSLGRKSSSMEFGRENSSVVDEESCHDSEMDSSSVSDEDDVYNVEEWLEGEKKTKITMPETLVNDSVTVEEKEVTCGNRKYLVLLSTPVEETQEEDRRKKMDIGVNFNKCIHTELETIWIGFEYGKNASVKIIVKEIDDDIVYQCPHCIFEADQIYKVASHLSKVHPDQLQYETCEQTYGLSSHVLIMHCRLCDFVTYSKLSMWKHFQHSHKARDHVSKLAFLSPKKMESIDSGTSRNSSPSWGKYLCPECQTQSVSMAAILLHVEKEHPKSDSYQLSYMCILEEQQLDVISDQTVASHDSRMVYICTKCVLYTYDRSRMINHCCNCHARGLLAYICIHCDMPFTRRSAIIKHLDYRHAGFHRLCCSVSFLGECVRSVQVTPELEQHANAESDAEPEQFGVGHVQGASGKRRKRNDLAEDGQSEGSHPQNKKMCTSRRKVHPLEDSSEIRALADDVDDFVIIHEDNEKSIQEWLNEPKEVPKISEISSVESSSVNELLVHDMLPPSNCDGIKHSLTWLGQECIEFPTVRTEIPTIRIGKVDGQEMLIMCHMSGIVSVLPLEIVMQIAPLQLKQEIEKLQRMASNKKSGFESNSQSQDVDLSGECESPMPTINSCDIETEPEFSVLDGPEYYQYSRFSADLPLTDYQILPGIIQDHEQGRSFEVEALYGSEGMDIMPAVDQKDEMATNQSTTAVEEEDYSGEGPMLVISNVVGGVQGEFE